MEEEYQRQVRELRRQRDERMGDVVRRGGAVSESGGRLGIGGYLEPAVRVREAPPIQAVFVPPRSGMLGRAMDTIQNSIRRRINRGSITPIQYIPDAASVVVGRSQRRVPVVRPEPIQATAISTPPREALPMVSNAVSVARTSAENEAIVRANDALIHNRIIGRHYQDPRMRPLLVRRQQLLRQPQSIQRDMELYNLPERMGLNYITDPIAQEELQRLGYNTSLFN